MSTNTTRRHGHNNHGTGTLFDVPTDAPPTTRTKNYYAPLALEGGFQPSMFTELAPENRP